MYGIKSQLEEKEAMELFNQGGTILQSGLFFLLRCYLYLFVHGRSSYTGYQVASKHISNLKYQIAERQTYKDGRLRETLYALAAYYIVFS